MLLFSHRSNSDYSSTVQLVITSTPFIWVSEKGTTPLKTGSEPALGTGSSERGLSYLYPDGAENTLLSKNQLQIAIPFTYKSFGAR